MSNLHIYEELPKLVYSFRDFIETVESASVTYHEIESTEEDSKSGEVRFNLFSSVEKYQSSLKSIFIRLVKDVDEGLNSRYAKIEKLNFLSRHLIEIEALKDLFKTKSGKTIHNAFTFNNLATDLTLKKVVLKPDDVQDFLNASHNMVIKFHRYFNELKHNVELTKQEEFELPAAMIPDPNEATELNPIAYFEYLISKNGVFKLLNIFKPDQDDYEYGYASYDEETQTKSYEEQDPETGEWDTVTYKFSDYLYNILVRQYNLSRDLIDATIAKAGQRKKIKFAIELWLSKLTYLKGQIELNKYFKKYEILSRPVDGIISFLHEKYGDFCPKPNKTVQALLEKSKQYQLPEPKKLTLPQSSQPGMFRWIKGNSGKNSVLVHGVLNKVFIQDTSLDYFHKAFSGGYPEQTYNIRWIDMTPNGKHTNKVTLLYLFKKLADGEWIDSKFDSAEMFMRLGRIFRDHAGEPLQNLSQSKLSVSKAKKDNTFTKNEIDKLIKAMAQN